MMKTVVGIVANAAVGTVISNVVNHTTPKNVKTAGKALTVVGSFVIGQLVTDQVTTYAEEQYDSVRNLFKKPEKKDIDIQPLGEA